MTVSQCKYPKITISMHPNILKSQNPDIQISCNFNIPIFQYSYIPIFELLNIHRCLNLLRNPDIGLRNRFFLFIDSDRLVTNYMKYAVLLHCAVGWEEIWPCQLGLRHVCGLLAHRRAVSPIWKFWTKEWVSNDVIH